MTPQASLSISAEAAQELSALRLAKLTRLYQREPVAYVYDRLKMPLTPDQAAVLRRMAASQAIFVKAAHSVGKSVVMAAAVNWSFDCFYPGVTITTAPTEAQVKDVLWKNIRTQRVVMPEVARKVLKPDAPRMETTKDHFAVGYTATNSDSFQGRHDPHMLIVIDEGVGVKGQFFTGAISMLTAEDNKLAVIYNPTDTSTACFQHETSGLYEVMHISAFDHPNIAAGLEGRPVPFPGAVTVEWIDDRISQWCEPVDALDAKPEIDVEWRGSWYRPGPEFEGRVLGRWPSQNAYSIWSDARWQYCLREQPVEQAGLQIGCDVARFGDDYTSIVARRGRTALHHETHNGWDTVKTTEALVELASTLAEDGEDPKSVTIAVDDDGVGGGVVDQLRAKKYNVKPVNGASKPRSKRDYPNMRSEVWFAVSEEAGDGLIDVSRLSPNSKKLLRGQLMGVRYKLNERGQRVVEKKDDTKKADRLGRSPDDADAFNLAYCKPKELVLTIL